MSNMVDGLLQERGGKYGVFYDQATLAQSFKDVLHSGRNWYAEQLTNDQREALEMICHKMSRILNGDPDYADSWVDIAGYAQLVADRLLERGDYAPKRPVPTGTDDCNYIEAPF